MSELVGSDAAWEGRDRNNVGWQAGPSTEEGASCTANLTSSQTEGSIASILPSLVDEQMYTRALMDIFGFGTTGWGWQFVWGLAVTLMVALIALPIGLPLGFACALAMRSKRYVPSILARTLANAFQAIPEILTIFAIYHGGTQLLGLISRSLGLQIGLAMPAVLAGALALGLVFAAYSSEVWRGALEGVGRGQREAGLALGLHPTPVLLLVVLPQAYKLALPGLLNLWSVLLKDTALVSVIAVTDLMRQVNLAVTATDQPFSLYIFACLVYVLLTSASSYVAEVLDGSASSRSQGRD